MTLSQLLQEVAAISQSPPDAAIWVALITSVAGIVGALLNNQRSTRHSKQIGKLQDELAKVKRQLQVERVTWHRWAREVVKYLVSLPNGQEIADGLPPMPDALQGHERAIRFKRRGTGRGEM